MSKLHLAFFAGAAAFVAAGTALAATGQWHTATVDLPDGSVAEIRYLGDVPPKVTVSMPVVQDARDVVEYEDVTYTTPRARRVVQAQPQPATPHPTAPQFVVAGDMPKGSTYQYTLITTGSDGKVCAQRTEWRSRGRDEEPEVRRTATGDGCAVDGADAARPSPSALPRKLERIDPDSI